MPLEKSVTDELQYKKERLKNSWLKVDAQDAKLLNELFQHRNLQDIQECTAFLDYVLKQTLSEQEYELLVQLDLSGLQSELLSYLKVLLCEKKDSLARIVLVLKASDCADLYLAAGSTIEYRSALTLCREKRLPTLLESGVGILVSQYFLLRICRQIRNVMDVLACPHVFCVKWVGSEEEVTIAASGTAYCSTLPDHLN